MHAALSTQTSVVTPAIVPENKCQLYTMQLPFSYTQPLIILQVIGLCIFIIVLIWTSVV